MPALKFLHFRTHSTRFRRIVHFEQLATAQVGEIDIFVILDPKKRHQGYITVLSTRIAENSVGHPTILISCYVGKIHARIQMFRQLERLEGEFDELMGISQHSRFF